VRAALVREACARQRAHVLHAAGERVALALQLREALQARAAEALTGGVARRIDGDVREPRGDDLRQLALQAGDLSAQRPACRLLVDELDARCVAIDRQLLGLAHRCDSSSCAGRPDSTSAGTANVTVDASPTHAARVGEAVARSGSLQRRSADPQSLLDVQLGHARHLHGE
jgi:hypothetical protein